MKKLHTSAFLAAATALAASPIIGITDVSAAASVSYAGFQSLNRNTLNGAYSYSKIYYTENTKVTNVKVGAAGTLNAVMLTTGRNIGSGVLKPGESYTALIENSTANDPDGNPLDVLYKVSDIHYWTDELDDDGQPVSEVTFNFSKTVGGSRSETHPEESSVETASLVHAGDPIIAWNNATQADSLFTVQFCKKGTYVAATDSCTIATNMTSVSSAIWDFDVPNNKRAKDGEGNPIIKDDGWYDYTANGDKLFHGNEGVLPETGVNTIYMNTSKTFDGTVMSTEQNGFSVKDINGGAYNGIWFGNSIMVTSTGLNGSWSYRYSGRGCGVGFLFGSAVPYEMPKPKKSVNKTTAKAGDVVTCRISQEVPDNFSAEADIVTFMSLWGNFNAIPQNRGYSALKITDSFDSNLVLPNKSSIKITNEKGTDVTSEFTITVSGQDVEAVAKNANTFDFYGHTYTMTISATVSSSINNSPVQNLAKTIYTPVDGSDITLPSDPVETKIYHTVVTKYVDDETGEEIADSDSREYAHGDHYTTSESDEIPEKYTLVETPSNAEGTADKDYEVVYRYRSPRKVIVRYVDDETGKPIADPTDEEYQQGDPYETSPLEKTPNGYQLVKTPENAKGTVGKSDIEVIYRYRKIKNPNTADGSATALISIVAASILGGGILISSKRRR